MTPATHQIKYPDAHYEIAQSFWLDTFLARYLPNSSNEAKPTGVCYGLMVAWLSAMQSHHEEALFNALQRFTLFARSPKSHNLSNEDIELFRRIIRYQCDQSAMIREQLQASEDQTTLDFVFEQYLKCNPDDIHWIISCLISPQLKKGYQLCFSFYPKNNHNGHAIGVLYQNDYYQVYDANRAAGTVLIENENALASYILRVMKQTYDENTTIYPYIKFYQQGRLTHEMNILLDLLLMLAQTTMLKNSIIETKRNVQTQKVSLHRVLTEMLDGPASDCLITSRFDHKLKETREQVQTCSQALRQQLVSFDGIQDSMSARCQEAPLCRLL